MKSVPKSKQDDLNEEPYTHDEMEHEEPLIEAFEEEELKNKSSGIRKLVIRLVAAVITVAMIVQAGSFLLEHFSLDALRFMSESEELTEDGSFEEFEKAVVTVQTGSGHGTGFVISETGEVLTNEHVVRDAGQIHVAFSDGTMHEADVVKSDPNYDLALLHISDETSFPALSLADVPAEAEDRVYVIGHPLTHSFIVNTGKVKESTSSFQVIEITNSVFPGHSGSPVLSVGGEVVGVVYARQQGGEQSGEGLAVPLHHIHSFLDD